MRATTMTALLGAVSLSFATLALATSGQSKPQRNTSVPACDQPDGSLTTRKNFGKGVAWSPEGIIPIEQSDDPVFYLSPGESACGGRKYKDSDAGVCLSAGWVNSAYHNSCDRWVEVQLPALGTKVAARVLDSCGGDDPAKSTFNCNDVYLTLSSWSALAEGNKTIIDAGRLPGPVNWRFIKEPCFGCEEGLPGIKPFGGQDTCMGPDDWGVMRNGRKRGAERKFGADAGNACSGLAGGGHGYNVDLFKASAIKHGYKLNLGHTHTHSATPPRDEAQQHEAGFTVIERAEGGKVVKGKKKRFELLEEAHNFRAKLMRNEAAQEGYEK